MASGKRPLNLRFGGWYSYREWAENGFAPKSTHDRTAKSGPPPAAEPATVTAVEAAAKPAVEPAAEPDAQKALPAGTPNPAPQRRPQPHPAPHAPHSEQRDRRQEREAHRPPDPPKADPADLYPLPPDVGKRDEPLIRPYILTGGRTSPGTTSTFTPWSRPPSEDA